MNTQLREALEAVLPFFEPEITRGPAIDEWNLACKKLEGVATYDDEEGMWKLKEGSGPDPYFRIGQLEGAIKGVILHLGSVNRHLNNPDTWLFSRSPLVPDGEKVIANLKELIGGSNE